MEPGVGPGMSNTAVCVAMTKGTRRRDYVVSGVVWNTTIYVVPADVQHEVEGVFVRAISEFVHEEEVGRPFPKAESNCSCPPRSDVVLWTGVRPQRT